MKGKSRFSNSNADNFRSEAMPQKDEEMLHSEWVIWVGFICNGLMLAIMTFIAGFNLGSPNPSKTWLWTELLFAIMLIPSVISNISRYRKWKKASAKV